LKLANDFDGEIVSADSRQIYRMLDIGTAKPTISEQKLVRHHIIDVAEPDQAFSLAQYQQLAYQGINNISDRNKLPILTGGSGLYVWAVLEGWQIPKVAPDLTLRHELEARAARGEAAQLYAELQQMDAEAAARIDHRNVRRVIRALEINRQPQKTSAPAKTPSPFSQLVIGLTCSRGALYKRIDMRVEGMIEQGLVDEVRSLIAKGYSTELPAMSGIGYRQIAAYLQGNTTLPDAIQQIKYESHRLARQQYNWFSLKNDTIHWFDVSGNYYDHLHVIISEFLKA
ncbi:MAG: tRNA (adenosine(37)-N6)-dimethylallyltransferase MiaA, partial [Dehalococcoidia bacterium]|nr:tRNA (adenosine(37)-N6)-dimethylallyltransferase MiaA [Dehalococcoidia bacterium]